MVKTCKCKIGANIAAATAAAAVMQHLAHPANEQQQQPQPKHYFRLANINLLLHRLIGVDRIAARVYKCGETLAIN